MVKNLIFTEKEALFLKELEKQDVEFIIVGLSAAALQGAPVVTQDIDLWFKDLNDPGLKKVLKKVGAAYVPPSAHNPPMFAGDAVNLFDIVVHMHGLDSFEEEKKHALSIALGNIKVLVLPLERVIKSKKVTGRQKDKIVLPVLKDALIAIKNQRKLKQ